MINSSWRITKTIDPLIKKFQKWKVYARFKDNIWAADLAEMGALPFFNCGRKYFLCMIDIFIKYALVKRLKDKKATTCSSWFYWHSKRMQMQTKQVMGWSRKRVLE